MVAQKNAKAAGVGCTQPTHRLILRGRMVKPYVRGYHNIVEASSLRERMDSVSVSALLLIGHQPLPAVIEPR